jgi:hypothetical protein
MKKNLEDIFQILYEQNKLDLAIFIQELYFAIDEEYDDIDYDPSDSEEDIEIIDDLEIEKFQYSIDEDGFYSLV